MWASVQMMGGSILFIFNTFIATPKSHWHANISINEMLHIVSVPTVITIRWCIVMDGLSWQQQCHQKTWTLPQNPTTCVFKTKCNPNTIRFPLQHQELLLLRAPTLLMLWIIEEALWNTRGP